MNKQHFFKIFAYFAFIFISFYFISCSDTVTNRPDNIEVSQMSSSDTLDHAGILVLDTVKILLKDIKLNVANSSDTPNFKTGPFVLYLNLSSSVNTIGSSYINVGTYDKIQFEVHKLDINETVPDPEFRDSTDSYSVIAKGSYLGTRFVFKSDKSAKQKLDFPNNLVVSSTMSNVTIKVLPYIWFIGRTGVFMDPNDPNNHDLIDNNIQENFDANFKAFKDDDKNGVPDP